MTRQHLKLLRNAKDATGAKLTVTVLPGPHSVRPRYEENEEFAASYINFYVGDAVVLVPQFGDKERDLFAQRTLSNMFPTRKVAALNIDAIAYGGGGIHCCTMQQTFLTHSTHACKVAK